MVEGARLESVYRATYREFESHPVRHSFSTMGVVMNPPNTIYVLYDDQCPFCRSYCRLLRLREAAGGLVLVDARKPSALMDEITARGLDIDQGMEIGRAHV